MKGPDRCTKLEQMVRATEKDFSPKCRVSAHRQGAKQRGRDEVNEAGYRNSTEGFENKVSLQFCEVWNSSRGTCIDKYTDTTAYTH